MALTYNSYWHEVTCDECHTSWDSPNGQSIAHHGETLSTMDLDCPECARMKEQAESHESTFWSCPECHTNWLKRGDVIPYNGKHYIDCPDCMEAHKKTLRPGASEKPSAHKTTQGALKDWGAF